MTPNKAKFVFIIPALILILCFSCQQKNKDRIAANLLTSHNYKMGWKGDSSYIFIAGYLNKNIDSLNIDKLLSDSNVIVIDTNWMWEHIGTVLHPHKHGHLLAPKDSNAVRFLFDLDNVNEIKTDTNSLAFKVPASISLKCFSGKGLYVSHNGPLSLGVEDFFHDIYIGQQYTEKPSEYCPLDVNIDFGWAPKNYPFDSTTNLTIKFKKLGNIGTLTNSINLYHCLVTKKSELMFAQLNTLSLNGLVFDHDTSYLKIENLTENQKKDRIVLKIEDTDPSQINLNYHYFVYEPEFNDRYSDVKKNYRNIIASQRRQYEQDGLLSALIDSSKYEDKQHFITALFIPIKVWWNNYGYNKSQVIYSILEVFLVVFLINLLIFKSSWRCTIYPE